MEQIWDFLGSVSVHFGQFRMRTEEDRKSKVQLIIFFKQQQQQQYLGIQSVDKEEMSVNLNLEQRREVRKCTRIRRIYN